MPQHNPPGSLEQDSVARELKNSAQTFEERNAIYGDAYKTNGRILAQYFPDGITLTTEEDFIRFSLMSAVITKMNRYSSQFENGGHSDSSHDAGIYAAMLTVFDREVQR